MHSESVCITSARTSLKNPIEEKMKNEGRGQLWCESVDSYQIMGIEFDPSDNCDNETCLFDLSSLKELVCIRWTDSTKVLNKDVISFLLWNDLYLHNQYIEHY